MLVDEYNTPYVSTYHTHANEIGKVILITGILKRKLAIIARQIAGCSD